QPGRADDARGHLQEPRAVRARGHAGGPRPRPGARALEGGRPGRAYQERGARHRRLQALRAPERGHRAPDARGAEGQDGGERGRQDMRTHIEGGWVVAFNGTSHEVHEQGSVVYEDDKIVHAGPAYTGPADTRINARGKLVSPGFINTHVHTAGNGGDYLLLDMAKNDYRTSNYMSF